MRSDGGWAVGLLGCWAVMASAGGAKGSVVRGLVRGLARGLARA